LLILQADLFAGEKSGLSWKIVFNIFIIMQQSIDTYDFSGKKAIVRVDFNVPLNEKMEITTEEEQGYIDCRFESLSDQGKLLMDSLILGLQNIVSNYGKKYLELKFKEV